eukprot:scaffold75384_cov57-Phaeocystis_antarctica.AAC.1
MSLRIVASFCSSLRSSPLPAPTALAAVSPAAAKPSLLRSCESVRPLTLPLAALGALAAPPPPPALAAGAAALAALAAGLRAKGWCCRDLPEPG